MTHLATHWDNCIFISVELIHDPDCCFSFILFLFCWSMNVNITFTSIAKNSNWNRFFQCSWNQQFIAIVSRKCDNKSWSAYTFFKSCLLLSNFHIKFILAWILCLKKLNKEWRWKYVRYVLFTCKQSSSLLFI